MNHTLHRFGTLSNKVCLAFLALALLAGAQQSVAQNIIPSFIWPLCGRLGEQPGNWLPGDPCPRTRSTWLQNDLPIHNGFGPRNFVNTNRPMSFHRGIDLATRPPTLDNGFVGNPVFAVCAGFVYRIFGQEPDKTLELKCPEFGLEDGLSLPAACHPGNRCITAVYRHVQGLLVKKDDLVGSHAHLGYTGGTKPGDKDFGHLHFEFLDPRDRPTSKHKSGLDAFSKDAINPLRYLPMYLPTESTLEVTLDSGEVFANYEDGAPSLSIQVQAEPGFMYDFVGLTVEVYQPDLDTDIWSLREKDLDAIAEKSEVWVGLSEFSPELGLAYPVADDDAFISHYEPERASRFYTPFSSNSTPWTFEKELTWYRTLFDGQHPGVDGLLERNASEKLPDGHLTQDFDFRLVRAYPNPDQPINGPNDPAEWWGLRIGLREYGAPLEPPFCIRAEVEQLPPWRYGPPRFRQVWLAQPHYLDCESKVYGPFL